MKSRIAKTAVVALAISVLVFFGCETIVTDVNAEMEAIYPNADLGIPVNYNENYIEVAYNPQAVHSDTEEEQVNEDEKTADDIETVSEESYEEEDALTASENETDTEEEESDEADD